MSSIDIKPTRNRQQKGGPAVTEESIAKILLVAAGSIRLERDTGRDPRRVSGIREKQWNEKQVAQRYQDEKSEIYAKIKRLYLQGEGLTPEILKTIKAYNDRVIESGRRDINPITVSGIREMLKRNSRASKMERIRAA